MAALRFIHGKPGAGKTRLALELKRSVPAVAFIEDAYLAARSEPITTLAQYVERARRVRELRIGRTALDLLRIGVSGVFDFAGNTSAGRA